MNNYEKTQNRNTYLLIAFMVLTTTSAVALVSQTTEENQGNLDFYTLGLLVSDLFIILAG